MIPDRDMNLLKEMKNIGNTNYIRKYMTMVFCLLLKSVRDNRIFKQN